MAPQTSSVGEGGKIEFHEGDSGKTPSPLLTTHSISSSYTRVQSAPELTVICFHLLNLPRLGFQEFPSHWLDLCCPIQPFPRRLLLLLRPSHRPAVLCWGLPGGGSASVMLLQVGQLGVQLVPLSLF